VANDAAAERLIHELGAAGYTVKAVVEQSAAARMATVRLAREPAKIVLDLLFASSGIEPRIVDEASVMEVVPEFKAPVARIGHLIALKILARDDQRRPQDYGDLRALLAVANATELDAARAALREITALGYSRSRDLIGSLDALLAQP